MKFLILTLLLMTFKVGAQEYNQQQLQNYVGYDTLYAHPYIQRDEIEFLSFYTDKTGPWHKEINEYLRRGFWFGQVPKKLNRSLNAMDRLIKISPSLPLDIVLYRGQRMDYMGRHYRIGEEFTDKAYFSATTDLSVARFYSGYSQHSFVMVLYFEENVPRGLVLNNTDKEVLLARDRVLKVMDSVKGNRRRYGLVQVCPASGCSEKIGQRDIRKWWKNFKKEHSLKNSDDDVPWGELASKLTEDQPLPKA